MRYKAGTMRPRLFGVALLSTVLMGLTPLAYASLPDQTWLSGIYDNADYDDVILALTSTVGAADGVSVAPVGPRQETVGTITALKSSDPAQALRVPYRLRAPPLA